MLDPRRGIFRQNVRAGFALGTGTPPVHVHGLVGERGSPYVGNKNRTASGPYYWCSTERLRCGAGGAGTSGSFLPSPTLTRPPRIGIGLCRRTCVLCNTLPHRVPHGPGSCTKHVGHFRLFSHFIFPWMPACRAMKATAFQLHPRISPSTAAFFFKEISSAHLFFSSSLRSGISSMFPFMPAIIF